MRLLPSKSVKNINKLTEQSPKKYKIDSFRAEFKSKQCPKED